MKRRKCKKLHVVNVEKTIIKLKCPWCKVVNEHELESSLFCDGCTSETTGVSAPCIYCKQVYNWRQGEGVGKGCL